MIYNHNFFSKQLQIRYNVIAIFPALFSSVNMKRTYDEKSPVFEYEEAPEYPN